MKKIISIILFSAILLSFAACASDTKKDAADTTKAPLSTEPGSDTAYYEPDELPALNFGGEKIVFLTRENLEKKEGVNVTFHESTFTVEDLNSNVLNDSIYNRELFVEDRLGVEIENYAVEDVDAEFEKMIGSGDDVYDAVVADNAGLSIYVFKDYLTDLYSVDYLDTTKPWWSQNFNREAELLGSLYLTTGSLCLSLYKNTYAVYYNKNLAENYSMGKPDLANLYGIVDAGKWTFDKFTQLGGDLYVDVNGNTVRDLDDIYGIAYDRYFPIDAIWSGFDIRVFSRTDDGWFDFDVNTDKMYTALDKIFVLINELEGSITANVGTDAETSYSCDRPELHFANGTNLFLVERLGYAEKETMRNMQDDYGVLPYPKYDENQKEYYSFTHDFYGAVVIPNTNGNPDTVGAVLEAMASFSYRDTIPAYLDTVLKGQYMSDPQSRRMIDTVVDGIYIDAAWIYVHTLANDYPRQYRYYLAEGGRSFATKHEQYGRKVGTVLKIYRQMLEK